MLDQSVADQSSQQKRFLLTPLARQLGWCHQGGDGFRIHATGVRRDGQSRDHVIMDCGIS